MKKRKSPPTAPAPVPPQEPVPMDPDAAPAKPAITVADRVVLKTALRWPEYVPEIGDDIPLHPGTVETHHPDCTALRAVIDKNCNSVRFYYVFAGQQSYVHESGQWAIYLCDGGEFDPDDLVLAIDAVWPHIDIDEEVCETAVRCVLDLLRKLGRSAAAA